MWEILRNKVKNGKLVGEKRIGVVDVDTVFPSLKWAHSVKVQ